ncbi:branched-chain amino acid ABC transporter substrate-binding protein [Vibrio sinaloensis]|uniref:Branched-chain amino acid ABC transporter substrate-binding protein n=2 Tax=Photobacterium sp. (strain ATCC 43367) TaxID=379097 RepID=A0A0A5I388_PHOS4|nr:substrate-binding protein [Vibrio sinaloensis]KGY10296.1 branched-chain amino acid ABC transporter substrate-binding protein [Vibrio sinaloensis]
MMKIQSFLLSLLALLNTSCSPEKSSIKLGAVLPLTGTFAIYGEQALKGAQLAVDEINANGGVLGRPLELIVRDNQTNPAKSVKLSRELIQQYQVFSLLGPVSSASRYAMTEVAEEFQTPLFYGIDYEGRHFSRYLICYSTIPEHYIEPIVPYLVNNVGDNFYIFGYDYIWPHRMSERIIESVEKHNGKVSNTEFTAFGVGDYTPVFERIKQSQANNLMLILPGQDGFNFLNQMASFDFEREIQVVAFAADETYLTNLPSSALDGVLTALHFFSSLEATAAQSFVTNYQKRFGQESVVTYSSKAHYDLIYLIAASLEEVGEVDKEKLIDALPNTTLYLGDSELRVREDHHVDLPMYLAQFREGSLSVIKNFGTIRPGDQRSNSTNE